MIDAQPRAQRVIVENLNVAKRHQKPQPIRDANRMGGAQMTPGGIIDKPMAVPVGNVMVVCPTCKLPTRIGYRIKEVKGETVKVRVCKRAGCGQEIELMAATETYVPRLKQRYNDELRAAAEGAARRCRRSCRCRGSRRSRSTWASARRRPTPRCSTRRWTS